MKILLVGNGQMGKVFQETINKDNVVEVIGTLTNDSFNNLLYKPDVIIDFSHPSNIDLLIKYLNQEDIPLVIGTTGYTKDQTSKIKELGLRRRVLLSSNYSYVFTKIKNILDNLKESIAKESDIHILEKHHANKYDKPSGTANELKKQLLEFDCKSLEISSIRGSNIGAEHEIIFMLEDEVLSIKHSVNSKAVYAKNVLKCCETLLGMKNGFYTFEDVIKERDLNEKA